MLHRAPDILFTIALLAAARPAPSFQQPTEKAVPIQWLAATGETSGVKFPTHKLRPLSLQNESGLPVEIEQEAVKVDEHTTRITRRARGTRCCKK